MNYADEQRNPTKHMVWFSVVIVMHIILGWALINGLARKVVEVIKGPIETKIIEEVKPPPPPPPENLPPPPKLPPPPPSFMPPPEVQIQNPAPAPTITVQREAPPPQPPVTIAPPPAPEAPPAPPRVAARPAITDATNCAPRNEDYPGPAIRAEATGTTSIRFTVDVSGKLAKVELVKSAGPTREHRMLDRVAMEKLSTCKFAPGTDENGKPVGATVDIHYVWKLN